MSDASAEEATGSRYRYDVCLSFAGERRDYVERVAARLRDLDVAVFYDEYETVALWGKDLYEHLSRVYTEYSRFCVLFASREYEEKVWTTHERRSAQARALQGIDANYILPARFDDTVIPGVRETIGYVDLRFCQPEKLAELIAQKIRSEGSTRPPRSILMVRQVPRNSGEIEELLAEPDAYWEYKLFAGSLYVGRAALAEKWMDHEMRLPTPARERVVGTTVLTRIREMTGDALALLARLNKVFSPEVQEWAFGLPGSPGDAERIKHTAKRLLEVFESFLDWAATMRGLLVPEKFARIRDIGAMLLDHGIETLYRFVEEFVAQVDRIPAILAARNGRPITVNIPLVLAVPDELTDQFYAECDRLVSVGIDVADIERVDWR